jgi:hypothetical protein
VARHYTIHPKRVFHFRRLASLVVLGVGTALAVVIVLRWPRAIADRLPVNLPTPTEYVGDGKAATNYPLTHTDPETNPSRPTVQDILDASDFTLIVGEGSGWHGYDVIKVRADGTCEHTFNDQGGAGLVWKRAAFTIDHATVLELRQLLVDIGYFNLPRAYHADVADGTQWVLQVSAAGKHKGVYCNNHFPPELIRISEFLRGRVLGAHPEARVGTQIDLDPMEQWRELAGER